MSLTVTPLGRVSGMPKAGNAASGYLVTDHQTTVLLDAGPGVSLVLSQVLDPAKLDAIFVTHMHIDHAWDVLAVAKMILATRMRMTREGITVERQPRIPCWIPQGATQTFVQMAALFPVMSNPIFDQAFELAVELVEYQTGSQLSVGALQLTPVTVQHVVPAHGVRVSSLDGDVVAYTGDTGWTPGLIELARDADLFICEATLDEPDLTGHGHLCAAEAGRAAQQAGARHLMLTHFLSVAQDQLAVARQQAAGQFAGQISIAEPKLGVTTERNPA